MKTKIPLIQSSENEENKMIIDLLAGDKNEIEIENWR